MNALLLEPVRPRLPAALARSLSKMTAAAHRFHRWAHHPLCTAYRGEVIALGHRARVCRGCAYVALGLGVGLGIAAVRVSSGVAFALVGGGALLALASLRVRLPKWLGRFAPALMLGAAAGGGAVPALAAFAVLSLAFVAYRGRAPNRAPCTSCPQRSLKICDGIAPIVKRERAVMRLADARIRRDQASPLLRERVPRSGG